MIKKERNVMGRMIRESMDAWRTVVVFVFSVSVCILSTRGSAGRQRAEDFLQRGGGDSAISDSPQPNEEDTVEQLWVNCGLDLMQLKESIENLDIFLSEMPPDSTEINFKTSSPTRSKLQKLIAVMAPQTKYTLLDCLNRQRFRVTVSGGENGSKIWYNKYIESLLGWHSAWRRLLGDRSKLNEDSAISPAVEPPNYSPAASHGPAHKTIEEFKPIGDEGSIGTGSGRSVGQDASTARQLRHTKPSKEVDTDTDPDPPSNTTIIVSIVITATGTLLLSTCMFCCFLKFQRNDILTDNGKKDERPLLTVSSSSTGSSRKSFHPGNSVKKDKFEISSFKTKSIQNEHAAILAIPGIPSPGEVSMSNSIEAPPPPPLPLKPPPGRATPPLKPPPGRPATPLKPPPGRPNPPPPTPPLKAPPGSSIPPPPVPAGPPPPPPPSGPRPPPPPKVGGPPRPPQLSAGPPRLGRPAPPAPNRPGNFESGAPKTKLKPFFWDKVLATPDHSMVWNDIRAGSFQFNEEMIETLFGYASADKSKPEHRKQPSLGDSASQYVRIIDPKKSQNLSILLKALNVTLEEVCDALLEGNELPIEFSQTFLKMAPTPDEELKLRLYNGEIAQLGPADRFLKAIIEIPFAYKRIDALLYMSTLQEEVSSMKDSFATIELACSELKSSRLFLKLLEAVLKTGNRMNDGTYRGGAQAFKLDTLLKLADVKGIDGKTTLLHFVVQEIIRSEGVRAARTSVGSTSFSSVASDDVADDTPHDSGDHYRALGLQVVSRLPGELENVRKAAILDADALTSTVEKLGFWLVRTKDFLDTEMKDVDEENGFRRTLKSFVEHADIDVTWLLGEEKRIRSLVKNTIDYFHGNSGKDEGLYLFVIVRDFMAMLEKACKEVKDAAVAEKKVAKPATGKEPPNVSHPVPDPRKQLLFPAIKDRRVDGSDSSNSDDDS